MSGRSASASLRNDSARAEDSFSCRTCPAAACRAPRALRPDLAFELQLRSSTSNWLSCATSARPHAGARRMRSLARSAGVGARRAGADSCPETPNVNMQATADQARDAPKPVPRTPSPEPRDPSPAPRNPSPDRSLRRSGLPSMSVGIGTPKYFSTVGAISMIDGASDADRPVRHQHAGRRREVVAAVIAAPLLHVRIDDARRASRRASSATRRGSRLPCPTCSSDAFCRNSPE